MEVALMTTVRLRTVAVEPSVGAGVVTKHEH